MKINYSIKAEILIKELKSFDRADFEAWYSANFTAGDRTILEYLLFKDKGLKNGTNKR